MSIGTDLIIAGEVVLLIGLAGYAWHILHVAKRTAAFMVRWFPALSEPDEFFALIDLSSEDSHFFERHGPVLNIEEIRQRATDGEIPFSGTKGNPTTSARWFTHGDLFRSIESALEHWREGARPKGGVFNFEFEHSIGEGFLKGGAYVVTTRHARVIIRGGNVVTAFPVLEPKGAHKCLPLTARKWAREAK